MSLSFPHHSVIATWHDDSLTCGKILIFLKKFKKLRNWHVGLL